jgi:hypothetical protein
MNGETSGKAIASLVFGILGLTGTCPCLGPILAVVLGAGEERGVGRAGFILGWIGVALQIAIVLAFGIFALFAGVSELR